MVTSRIGTLHLRYRSRGGTLAAAMAPHLDRLIAARLGDAIEARLPAIVGDDGEVIVIRELGARVAVGRSDWSLDSRFVDRIGRASIEALAATLSRPASADEIVRFADQAEFVGSFIVDLLAGAAWDRWYFGAFGRYRDADTASTIAAVLADNQAHAAAVFGWLGRRGRLDEVVALLGSERARSLASGDGGVRGDGSQSGDEAPLMAAAFELVDALGWTLEGDGQRAQLAAAYRATNPLPPAWSERRSLTAWVLGFVRFVLGTLPSRDRAGADRADEAVARLLRGALDWLDAEWIGPQLHHAAQHRGHVPGPAPSSRRVLTGSHERALDRLADVVRRRGALLRATRDRRLLSVRLLALATEAGAETIGSDRGLIAAVDRIADAFCASVESGIDAQRIALALARGTSTPGALPAGHRFLAERLDQVRDAGPAASGVLHQLLKNLPATEAPGASVTALGGLYLLTRSLLDVRMHALARETGVPFEPLKAALASWWFEREPPFDAGAATWIGLTAPTPGDLDPARVELGQLRAALFERLRDQRAIETMPGGGPIASIGSMILQAWSRWLPGIAGSSHAFVIRNCLRRSARIRVSSTDIDVDLDPAPLDVVVEMAGYFKPIERVPWLNGRTVRFSVRRSARM